MLMTKFDKCRKIGLFGFLFRNIRFWQVQRRIKTRAKLEDFKIRGVLRHGKRLRGVKEPSWRKSKPKAEGRKNQTVWFWIPEYPIFPEQIESD
jgi:hypothetical protein